MHPTETIETMLASRNPHRRAIVTTRKRWAEVADERLK
jgi:hypothetical protein